MDEVVEQPITHRPIMPQRPDLRFWTELADHISHMFTIEGVIGTCQIDHTGAIYV